MNNNEVSIVLSADHAFTMPLGIAILSILKNKNKNRLFSFYILDGGLHQEDKEKINLLFKENDLSRIQYITIDQEKFKNFFDKRHFSKAANYRLLAPEIINSEKIIYLDCDIIVNLDLSDLYDIDLKNNILGAIQEVSDDYVKKYYFRNIKRYFNSGVLLINNKKWIDNQIWEKSNTFIAENKNLLKYPDQDTLNHLLENDWLELDKKFNTQLDIHQKKGIEEKSIFHFVGAIKPWHYRYNNSYKNLFLKYLKESPWNDYRYPDKTFLNILKRFLLDPTFLISKNILKLILPKFMLKKLKNKFWEISNKRDSK